VPYSINPTFAVVLQLLIGLLVAYLAHQRGRNPIPWFVGGVFGGVIALAILVFLPDLERGRLWRRLEWMESNAAKGESQKDSDQPDDVPEPILEESTTPVVSQPAAHGWYLARPGGNPEGPFALDTLRKRFQGGELMGFLVWQEGLGGWMPAEASPIGN
jgi:hypothetical protein